MNKNQEAALKKLTGDEDLFATIAEKLNAVNRTAENPAVITRGTETAPAATTQAAAQTPAKPAGKGVAAIPAPKPVANKRDWTKEDVKELMATPEFKGLLDEVMSAGASTAPGEEGDDEPETTPEGGDGPESETRMLTEVMRGILDELKASRVERESSLSVQTLLADIPSKIATQQMYRPRNGAAINPANVNRNTGSIDMAAVAAQTLEKMGATEE